MNILFIKGLRSVMSGYWKMEGHIKKKPTWLFPKLSSLKLDIHLQFTVVNVYNIYLITICKFDMHL